MGTSLSLLRLLFLLFLSYAPLFLAQDSILEDELSTNLLQEAIINHINANPKYGWKARIYPRFANYTVGQFKRLFGGKSTPESESRDIPVLTHDGTLILPKELDARDHWPSCSTIGRIQDQGHCGCCWAFASVGSLSDRFCIHLRKDVALSVNDPLACCGFGCGGCTSGYPFNALRYAKTDGIVTEECYPYFDTKGCPNITNCAPQYPTPDCVKKCVAGTLQWKETKHFAQSVYKVFSSPTNIMEEVYKNGPVSVMFDAYLDFATYESGVYKHVTGVSLGKHVVKLIGWGTTADREDYWLLANQWNKNWGEEGYVKFKRGTNECHIESDVVAVIPSTKNLINDEVASNSLHHASV